MSNNKTKRKKNKLKTKLKERRFRMSTSIPWNKRLMELKHVCDDESMFGM